MKCNNTTCNNETNNPKYCSQSCSASQGNRNSPRKTKTKQCKCGQFILSNRKYCAECRNKDITNDLTLLEMKQRYKHLHRSSTFVLVRNGARKKNKITHCQKCGYDKHVEVCHIRPIHTFPDSAKLSEVNADDNLIVLCPNCHWEFDNTK